MLSGIFMILGVFAPVAFITILVIVIVSLVKKDNNFDFNKFMKNIYIYLLIVIFLIITIYSIISAFDSTMELLLLDDNNSNSFYNSHNQNLNNAITSGVSALVSLTIFVYYSRLSNKYKIVENK